MVQQQTVLLTKNNGNFITEIFILIIASIYLQKIVVVKLQKSIVFKYYNVTIIHLPKITENVMTKYYIKENIEKYSIKMLKSTMRKRLQKINHKQRQSSSS
jgi:hypothetical protein